MTHNVTGAFERAAELFAGNFEKVLKQLAAQPDLMMRCVGAAMSGEWRECNKEEAAFLQNNGIARLQEKTGSWKLREGWRFGDIRAPWAEVLKAAGKELERSAPQLATRAVPNWLLVKKRELRGDTP